MLHDISRRTRESIAAQQQEFLAQARENLKTLPDDIKLTADYHIAIKYYSRHLLSLLETSFTYPGGAHPNTTFISYNARIDHGTVEPFDIAGLFKPGTPCFSGLSAYILSELRHRGAEWVTNGQIKSLKPEDLSTFLPAPHHPHRLRPLRRGAVCAGGIFRAYTLPPGLRSYQPEWAAGAVHDGSAVIAVEISGCTGWFRIGFVYFNSDMYSHRGLSSHLYS